MTTTMTSKWYLEGELLCVELRTQKNGINYGLVSKIRPDADPIEAMDRLREAMKQALDENEDFIAWLNGQR